MMRAEATACLISHEYVMPFAWVMEQNTNGMTLGAFRIGQDQQSILQHAGKYSARFPANRGISHDAHRTGNTGRIPDR